MDRSDFSRALRASVFVMIAVWFATTVVALVTLWTGDRLSTAVMLGLQLCLLPTWGALEYVRLRALWIGEDWEREWSRHLPTFGGIGMAFSAVFLIGAVLLYWTGPTAANISACQDGDKFACMKVEYGLR